MKLDPGFKRRAAIRRKTMKVVVKSLDDPDDDSDILAMSPSERFALVEVLRANGYAFSRASLGPRLPRHDWPVVKSRR